MLKAQRKLFYLVLFLMTLLLSACSSDSDSGDNGTVTPVDPAQGSEWDKMEWDKGQWK